MLNQNDHKSSSKTDHIHNTKLKCARAPLVVWSNRKKKLRELMKTSRSHTRSHFHLTFHISPSSACKVESTNPVHVYIEPVCIKASKSKAIHIGRYLFYNAFGLFRFCPTLCPTNVNKNQKKITLK